MYNFVSLIINTGLLPRLGAATSLSVDNTHSFFHVKFNLILQLIKGISSDLKRLLKYFNGMTIFTFFLATLRTIFGLPNKLTLYLKELDVSVAKLFARSFCGSSRLY